MEGGVRPDGISFWRDWGGVFAAIIGFFVFFGGWRGDGLLHVVVVGRGWSLCLLNAKTRRTQRFAKEEGKRGRLAVFGLWAERDRAVEWERARPRALKFSASD